MFTLLVYTATLLWYTCAPFVSRYLVAGSTTVLV
jgi:hypothetical protein